jgi:bifunctional non-homologous end joining protein LigD
VTVMAIRACTYSRQTVEVPLERACYSAAAMLSRAIRPIRLSRRSEPFDSDEFLFELKIDGFRALAFIQNGTTELVSRNGNTFRQFGDLTSSIAQHIDHVERDGTLLLEQIMARDMEGIVCTRKESTYEVTESHRGIGSR